MTECERHDAGETIKSKNVMVSTEILNKHIFIRSMATVARQQFDPDVNIMQVPTCTQSHIHRTKLTMPQ